MKQSRLIAIGSIFLAAALSVPLWGADPAQPENSKPSTARPGTLNYVEGQVSMDGESVGPEAIGTAELSPNQSLETQAGKAELLLTPGIFLRMGDNSSVTMISPRLTDTELRLDKGEGIVEAAELLPQTDIVVEAAGARVRLAEAGLYGIDADNGIVRVYSGEVYVDVNNREIDVKSGSQFAFNADASMQLEQFDQNQAQDDLYQWSSLRSSYLAEANVDRAQPDQMGNSYGDGWDWDPNYDSYTFVPADGVFYSPFGWGFYSPYYVGYAPFLFYGHDHHHFDHDPHHWDHDGGNHEAHYYDHFDHGAYRGPGSGYYDGHGAFVGRYRGGELAGGQRMQPGAGYHPGHNGEGFGGEGFNGGHGGEGHHGGEGSHGGTGIAGPHGGEGSHGGHEGGGSHGGGSVGGSHGMGGGGGHGHR